MPFLILDQITFVGPKNNSVRCWQHPGKDSGKSVMANVTDFVVVDFVEELAFFLRLEHQ